MKTVLITGVTSGLGKEIAQKFVRKGWNVIGLGRNTAQLVAMQMELGRLFSPFEVDISNSIKLEACFQKILLNFPVLDVLINNAAVFKLKEFDQCTIGDIDNIIDTNLKGPMYCTLLALRSIKRESGRIVNISSVAGTHGIKLQSIYCASKFGLNGFGQALGQELLDRGISLTTISPGGINTPLWSEENNPYPGENKEKLIQPNELAKMVERIVELPSNMVVKDIVVFPSNEWH
ncbi:SDR family oxidoreductase [Polynucleobacter sp. 80A-SIGWE]|uniref:SDR family oxidoreductase n=1 Tax=Polynucleobacter sp. 80A-SIGWE TaxID=2689100 RepID=UPI001C0BB3FB|nr:SDR family oxidoreductase [Polynucleobacter sp. 80A-SIGWE]MBU3589068.1 SDR family oxidoreductase [Polynucleobacter sp. 80A-SIGWE]